LYQRARRLVSDTGPRLGRVSPSARSRVLKQLNWINRPVHLNWINILLVPLALGSGVLVLGWLLCHVHVGKQIKAKARAKSKAKAAPEVMGCVLRTARRTGTPWRLRAPCCALGCIIFFSSGHQGSGIRQCRQQAAQASAPAPAPAPAPGARTTSLPSLRSPSPSQPPPPCSCLALQLPARPSSGAPRPPARSASGAPRPTPQPQLPGQLSAPGRQWACSQHPPANTAHTQ
jgi:hypothetical protein